MCDFGISGQLVDSVAKTRDAGCRPYMAVCAPLCRFRKILYFIYEHCGRSLWNAPIIVSSTVVWWQHAAEVLNDICVGSRSELIRTVSVMDTTFGPTFGVWASRWLVLLIFYYYLVLLILSLHVNVEHEVVKNCELKHRGSENYLFQSAATLEWSEGISTEWNMILLAGI